MLNSMNNIWAQPARPRLKRKRADIACEVCHAKKVKCDLQTRYKDGYSSCSYCTASRKDCRPRQSKRNRGRSDASVELGLLLTPPGEQNDSIQPLEHNVMANEGNSGEGASAAPVTHARGFNPNFALSASAPVSYASQTTSVSTPRPGSLILQSNESRRTSNADYTASPLSFDERMSNYSADVGFLHVYGPEHELDAMSQSFANQARQRSIVTLEMPSPVLLQGFIDTYFEHCYSWCPVLDRERVFDEVQRSPMLANAIALAASHIQPPMMPHPGPAVYYRRSKRAFYDDEEQDIMIALKSLSLFYWWSPTPPTAVHKNSSWWWQTVIIRHAQQIGIHREPSSENSQLSEVDLSLRRRIWWTAYARERLTALCQSKPAIIHGDDCTILEPTLDDFPDTADTQKAEIFIQWVKLCGIIGSIAKHVAHNQMSEASIFPSALAEELISWVRAVPHHLNLPIDGDCTTQFHRDVHQLYLPYLAVIVVLHLRGQKDMIPQANPAAIMAASCMARIMRDILARGTARSLMAISCWYTGIAFLGLLSASRTENLAQGANEDLNVLTLAIKQLKQMWPTANIFDQGFERLRQSVSATDTDISGIPQQNTSDSEVADYSSSNTASENVKWIEFFPFVTPCTSKIAKELLANTNESAFFEHEAFPELMMSHFQELFEPFEEMVDMPLFS